MSIPAEEIIDQSSQDGSTRNQTSSNGTNHVFRDGRRYHGDAEVSYILPNDDDGLLIYSIIFLNRFFK